MLTLEETLAHYSSANDETKAAWTKLFVRTGVLPLGGRNDQMSMMAREIWNHDPAALRDEHLRALAVIYPWDALKAYEDRATALAAREKRNAEAFAAAQAEAEAAAARAKAEDAIPAPPATPMNVQIEKATRYDSKIFSEAIHKFNHEPKALTDEEIAMLAFVSSDLGERGRARRAGFVEEKSELVRDFGDHATPIWFFEKFKQDEFWPFLTAHRCLITEVEKRIAALEKQEPRAAKLDAVEIEFNHNGTSVAYPPPDIIRKNVDDLIKRIDTLERTSRASSKEAFKSAFQDAFKGVWNIDFAYEKGDLVQWGGGCWIAVADSKSVRPGQKDNSVSLRSWKLFVMRGKEGPAGPAAPRG